MKNNYNYKIKNNLRHFIIYCFVIPRKRPNEHKRVRIGAIDITVFWNMEIATPRYKKQYIIKYVKIYKKFSILKGENFERFK